jgi:hypothetical protein
MLAASTSSVWFSEKPRLLIPRQPPRHDRGHRPAETGNTALGHILHVLVLPLQDQRHLGIEAARAAGGGRTALGGAGAATGARRFGFGLAEFLLKGGDALLVSAFHVIDLGADGSQFAVIGGVRAKGGSQHGCHGKTFLHGMLLKIAVRPLTTRLP